MHQQYALDTTAIRSALGYREIVPVADGIRRTAAWQSANPPEADRLGDYDADTAAIRQLGR